MAKMFYTLAEAKDRLASTDEQIKQLSRDGRLREFRDGHRLMYRADQVEYIREETLGLMREEVELSPIVKDGIDDLLKISDDIHEPDDLLSLSTASDDTALGANILNEIKETQQTMDTFKYEAMSSTGQGIKDVLEAVNSEEAIKRIRAKGYFPTKVQTSIGPKEKKERSSNWAPKQPLAWRIFKAIVLLVVGFIGGFITCYALGV